MATMDDIYTRLKEDEALRKKFLAYALSKIDLDGIAAESRLRDGRAVHNIIQNVEETIQRRRHWRGLRGINAQDKGLLQEVQKIRAIAENEDFGSALYLLKQLTKYHNDLRSFSSPMSDTGEKIPCHVLELQCGQNDIKAIFEGLRVTFFKIIPYSPTMAEFKAWACTWENLQFGLNPYQVKSIKRIIQDTPLTREEKENFERIPFTVTSHRGRWPAPLIAKSGGYQDQSANYSLAIRQKERQAVDAIVYALQGNKEFMWSFFNALAKLKEADTLENARKPVTELLQLVAEATLEQHARTRGRS